MSSLFIFLSSSLYLNTHKNFSSPLGTWLIINLIEKCEVIDIRFSLLWKLLLFHIYMIMVEFLQNEKKSKLYFIYQWIQILFLSFFTYRWHFSLFSWRFLKNCGYRVPQYFSKLPKNEFVKELATTSSGWQEP